MDAVHKFECINVCKSVSGRQILHNIDMHVSRGEIIALLGSNGAGKTTCFSILSGLIKPDSGEIKLDGVDVSALPMYRRARLGVGYLPQEASTFRGLTVFENLIVVLEHKKCKNKEEVAELLLNDFALSHVRNTKSVLLSGGERRKLEIARALANDPKYILLDEPFAGVDPISITDMKQTIVGLRKRNIGVIITDHNVRDTLPIVDRAYIIDGGTIIAVGNMNEIIKNDNVVAAYLGDVSFT